MAQILFSSSTTCAEDILMSTMNRRLRTNLCFGVNVDNEISLPFKKPAYKMK
jgi:hypothetical protein